MDTSTLGAGDVVLVKVGGREHVGTYVGPGGLEHAPHWHRVDPHAPGVNYYHVAPTEIRRRIRTAASGSKSVTDLA